MNRPPLPEEGQSFDVLVIGGGIYGAWVAREASRRGHRVCLVDKNDWASGTSSCSSKLIHGGLRYLEHGWLGVVKKSLNERRELNRLAPHQVSALRFGIPITQGGRLKKWPLKLGLMLYDFLATGHQPVAPHQHLNRQQFSQKFPHFKEELITSGFTYGDCQVDDARLTLEVVLSAKDTGCLCLNHVAAEALMIDGKTVNAVRLKDSLSQQQTTLRAKTIVSAMGPWQGLIEGGASFKKNFRFTKGVHLVLPFVSPHACLLTAVDGRVFFMIPWHSRTLVGTTDTNYTASPDDLSVDDNDITYLLDSVNAYLKQPWTRQDVLATFAGIRTLKHVEGASPSEVSRAFELLQPLDNCFVPQGGKLTSARLEAQQTLEALSHLLPSVKTGTSQDDRLIWSPHEPYDDWLKQQLKEGEPLAVDNSTVTHLAHRHGTSTQQIFELIRQDSSLGEPIEPTLPFVKAEILKAVQDEMACTVEDVLRRRLPLEILLSDTSAAQALTLPYLSST